MADVESWGLNAVAFNMLLALLATRNKRVVVLSGDVHWGFAATADYHATAAYTPYTPATQTLTSRIIQLTSSGIRNMTEAGPVNDRGILPILPVNVSGILHRTSNFFVGATGPKEFAGWGSANTGVTLAIDPTARFENWLAASYGPLGAFEGTPPILHLPPPTGTTFSKPEDWRVRIEWVEGERPAVPIVRRDFPVPATGFESYHIQVGAWLANQVGRGMVGEPNIAELSFKLVGTRPSVVQVLHWSEDPTLPAQNTTTWTIPLDPPAATWPPKPLYP
jgi:hypothetical protein